MDDGWGYSPAPAFDTLINSEGIQSSDVEMIRCVHIGTPSNPADGAGLNRVDIHTVKGERPVDQNDVRQSSLTTGALLVLQYDPTTWRCFFVGF